MGKTDGGAPMVPAFRIRFRWGTRRRVVLVAAALLMLGASAAACTITIDDVGSRRIDTETTTTVEASGPLDLPGGATSTPSATSTTTPLSEGPGSVEILTDPSPPVPTAPASALVDSLVIDERPPDSDYRRKAFGDGWNYDPASGCNTRERVLAAESGPGLVVDDRCRPIAGSWVSAYDGMTTGDIADLEIDHLVPLSDAWRSGADRWSDQRRNAFSNDLDDPDTLIAVSSHSNRSKGDSSPDRWLPELQDARCDYVEGWVRVKYRWELTVTGAEKATLVQVLSGC